MGEVKKEKQMSVLIDTTIRGIVNIANTSDIKKEDIVTLLKENGQYMLIYYK